LDIGTHSYNNDKGHRVERTKSKKAKQEGASPFFLSPLASLFPTSLDPNPDQNLKGPS
jgi:hypothetical protein